MPLTTENTPLADNKVREVIFTIRSVCEEIYTNHWHGTRREDITTTTTNNTTTQQGFCRENIFTKVFELITSTEMHSLYRGKASLETAQLLVYLTLHRASVTIRNLDVLGPKGIFTDRRDLHNIMRKLEDLGLVEKFLEKPWKGGKHYALWNAVWASNLDIQLAIEEHNQSLEKESFEGGIPPPKIPDEKLLVEASLSREEREYYQKYVWPKERKDISNPETSSPVTRQEKRRQPRSV